MSASAADHPDTTTSESSPLHNVKETIESILIAFVLAFIFRAFIVEAFVIPTGSMAPTLYGEHAIVTCSTCGYEYARGITPSDQQNVAENRLTDLPVTCPNCDTLLDAVEPTEVFRPHSGDRILVHKWPYAIGGEQLDPQPWDVTVFKDPRDGQTNFIKRLIGLPGNVLEIIDGDIYTAPVELLREEEPGLVEEFDQLRRDVYHHGYGKQQSISPAELTERYRSLNQRVLPYLTIQRKLDAPRAQTALWFTVYDHDYLPDAEHSPAGRQVRWEAPADNNHTSAEPSWNTQDREIRFDNLQPDPQFIEFIGKPIVDFYAYNNHGIGASHSAAERLVGDIRLRFVWLPENGDGGLILRMNRDRDFFTAEIGIDGQIRLVHNGSHLDLPGHRQVIGEADLGSLASRNAVSVEFINVDFRVSIRIDGREVLATSDQQYKPDLPYLLEADRRGGVTMQPSQVRIGAKNLSGRLRHLAIERDVYYRSADIQEKVGLRSVVPGDPASQVKVYNPYVNWPGWGTSGHPILLRDGEIRDYFMCGDNSHASKDSRLWWEIGPHLEYLGDAYQIGTVPEQELTGKAFFVYWPAGYRRSWSSGIGVIPNFGRMRWIR